MEKKTETNQNLGLYINTNAIITVILIISLIYLLFDYCSFNFGIESDSSNMCQYILLNKTFGSIYNFIYYILTFRNTLISIIFYTLIIGVIIYYLYTINMLHTFKDFILNELYNYSMDKDSYLNKVTTFDLSFFTTKLYKCATK